MTLTGYTLDGGFERERRLARELRTLASSSLLHCPSLLRPSAIVVDSLGRTVWLEHAHDGLASIVDYIDATSAPHATEGSGGMGAGGGGEADGGGGTGSGSGGEAIRHHERIRELMRQALTALAFMHASRLVHKNLTPLSLLVGRDG